MTDDSVATAAPAPAASPLEVVYQHIAHVHYRLATAEGIVPELAANCIDDLSAAMHALEPLLPPLPRREPTAKRRREPAG